VDGASSPSTLSTFAGAALIGGSTGLRSQMGMAVLLNGTRSAELPALFRHRVARPLALAAALAELVVDKLPSTPARTQAPGLVSRIGLGGLSAGVLGRNARAPTTAFAAVGAGAAVVAAFAGMAARQALAKRLPPLGAALAEDLGAVALAIVALRLTPKAPVADAAAGAPNGSMVSD
jgi:uncharacterized membrane protein